MKKNHCDRTALSGVLVLALGVAAIGTGVFAADAPDIAAIATRRAEQISKISSLWIRVREVTELSDDWRSHAWPEHLPLPEYTGTVEVLFAYKGDKRYRRVLGLDCQRIGTATSSSGKNATGEPARFDRTVYSDGKTVWAEQREPGSGRLELRRLEPKEARDCFPPPNYLVGAGLLVTDPALKSDVFRRFQQSASPTAALGRPLRRVMTEAQMVDGTRCIVLESTVAASASKSGQSNAEIRHALSLDRDHGFALRTQQWRGKRWILQADNSDFVEMLPGFWCPRKSKMIVLSTQRNARQEKEHPIMQRQTVLCLWIVNAVPDEIFVPLQR